VKYTDNISHTVTD